MDDGSSRVALVLNQEFTDDCMPLQELMPVWIIDSPGNRFVVEKIRRQSSNVSLITTFKSVGEESPGTLCERIVQSVDDHHNEHSQTPGYDELRVFGVSLADVSLRPFLELNFVEFVQTPTGFIAKKGK